MAKVGVFGAVEVDRERCRRLGRFLDSLHFQLPEEELEPEDIPASDARTFYFLLVAICHQTTPIGKPRLEGTVDGKFYYGYEYLYERWIRAAKADPLILSPGWLLTAEAGDIITILRDRERGSTISDPEGRAELLRDIGRKMLQDGVRHVDEYYAMSGGWLRDHDGRAGLETLFSRFEAYGKDPVKKKLTLFLILMKRYGYWEYRDSENLGAPVDYHEMRLHLRLGTVRVLNETLIKKINSGKVLTSAEDVAIRQAVYDAIFEISRSSGRIPADLHNLFWHMSRNCCRRDETHCTSCSKHGSLPVRYVALLRDYRCAFVEHCRSASLPHSEKIKEPLVDTDLY